MTPWLPSLGGNGEKAEVILKMGQREAENDERTERDVAATWEIGRTLCCAGPGKRISRNGAQECGHKSKQKQHITARH
jgi:hypothetical protein